MLDYGYGIGLRRIEKEDLSTLKGWRNEPSIRDYCRQVGLLSNDDQENWFKLQNTDKSMRMFVISPLIDEYPTRVGVCGLTSIDPLARKAEFSCYIAPEYQRLGFASSALRTLFHFGFQELNLNLIWGESFSGNPALDLFSKLGLRSDGVRRYFYFKNGEYLHAHLVSITKDEWSFPEI